MVAQVSGKARRALKSRDRGVVSKMGDAQSRCSSTDGGCGFWCTVVDEVGGATARQRRWRVRERVTRACNDADQCLQCFRVCALNDCFCAWQKEAIRMCCAQSTAGWLTTPPALLQRRIFARVSSRECTRARLRSWGLAPREHQCRGMSRASKLRNARFATV